MRLIKLAILSFIFLFLIVTVISLFIPGDIRISRATDINSTRELVMSFISEPAKWNEWYPGGDSLDLLYVEGKAKGILTDRTGMQGLHIDEISDSTVSAIIVGRVLSRLKETGWKVFRGSKENSITVQWYMDFSVGWYPWEKFRSLFYESIYGPQMEQGLANLKQLSETSRSSSN